MSEIWGNILRPPQVVNIKDSYNGNTKTTNNINFIDSKNKKRAGFDEQNRPFDGNEKSYLYLKTIRDGIGYISCFQSFFLK